MNFEPQKFFIGLMDFFFILLPGAWLTYLLMGEVGPMVLGAAKYQKLAGAEGLAVFLVTSYLFGHLIFLVGTWLDEFYDKGRRLTLNNQIKRLAHKGQLLPWPLRALVWLVFGQERDVAVTCARNIKEEMLKGLHAKKAINTFQWAKALLLQEQPDSLMAVQRFEASSKFFRCLVVVLLVLVIWWGYQHKWRLVALGLALTPLALWRYLEQRYKSTNQAYWAVITLTAKTGHVVLNSPIPDGLTHAGGVVFRKCLDGKVEYLLVEVQDDPKQQVLPHGLIEAGEHPRETAVREVHEATGVWARLLADLGAVSFSKNGVTNTRQFFLMEYAGRGLRQEVKREYGWFPYEQAIINASYLDFRDMLMLAEARRLRL